MSGTQILTPSATAGLDLDSGPQEHIAQHPWSCGEDWPILPDVLSTKSLLERTLTVDDPLSPKQTMTASSVLLQASRATHPGRSSPVLKYLHNTLPKGKSRGTRHHGLYVMHTRLSETRN